MIRLFGKEIRKIFHPTKVEQVTEILEDTSIPRGKKLTTEIVKEKVGATNSTSATSKIGFQFFANKKDTFDVKDMPLSNEPEFIKEITLTGYPKNGETPNSIILEYSDKIDPNFKGEIFVIRRDL